MNTKELFELITKDKGWNEGYCPDSTARVLKHRHDRGELAEKSYTKLFKAFGYKQINEVKWGKETT